MFIIQRINRISGERMYLHIITGTNERVYVGDRSAAKVYMDRIEAVESYQLALTCTLPSVMICMQLHTRRGWVRFAGTEHDIDVEIQELVEL